MNFLLHKKALTCPKCALARRCRLSQATARGADGGREQGLSMGSGRSFWKNGMKKPCTYCTGIHHLGFQFQKGLG